MSERVWLPEQRHMLSVMFGGISAVHVVHRSTFSPRRDGRWTGRAYDRRALCGALRAAVVGAGGIETWPTEPRPVDDFQRVTCARCRAKYERMFPAEATS